MGYNVVKFFLAFFGGKMVATLLGAYSGRALYPVFESLFGPIATAALAVLLTIAITFAMLRLEKIDEFIHRLMGEKAGRNSQK